MTQVKMKEHEPLVENGIVVGTGSNKYGMKNPIGRLMLSNFDRTIDQLVANLDPEHILEVGCGEGHITALLEQNTRATIHGLDISDRILEQARQAVPSERVSFENRSIYDLDPEQDGAPCVVCCEVLEHLDDPVRGLRALAACAKPYAIISVPNEPLFRTLNFLRGAYVKDFGNSPGHIQHWSRGRFKQFVAQEFDILAVRSPMPWTVIYAKSRVNSN